LKNKKAAICGSTSLPRRAAACVHLLPLRGQNWGRYRLGWNAARLFDVCQSCNRAPVEAIDLSRPKKGQQNANHETLQDILELGRDAKKHFADNKQIADVVMGGFPGPQASSIRFVLHATSPAFLQASKTLRKKLNTNLGSGLKDPTKLDRRILDAVRDILDLVESAFGKIVDSETVQPCSRPYIQPQTRVSFLHSLPQAGVQSPENEPYIRKEGSLGGYVMDSGKILGL